MVLGSVLSQHLFSKRKGVWAEQHPVSWPLGVSQAENLMATCVFLTLDTN